MGVLKLCIEVLSSHSVECDFPLQNKCKGFIYVVRFAEQNFGPREVRIQCLVRQFY